MRGDERIQEGMFSYVLLEQRVPGDHPLRAIRKLKGADLGTLCPELDTLYVASERPSMVPDYILRALLLQVFDLVRLEQMLVEQIAANLNEFLKADANLRDKKFQLVIRISLPSKLIFLSGEDRLINA
jgi:hypothetical protein